MEIPQQMQLCELQFLDVKRNHLAEGYQSTKVIKKCLHSPLKNSCI